MAYDLLVKNGRIVDGSGMPSFRGDVAVKNGKIVETGKLSGPATRVIDADGLVISPGFIDNHCHYDAQVLWDPLCSFSCYHGVTTVVIGNCSLALAPVRQTTQGIGRVLEFLSYVEAIPMDVLRTVDMTWETIPQYMDILDRTMGVNVGTLIGHTPLRYYVMGEESQNREASAAEIQEMREIVREALMAGALGLSLSRNRTHYDSKGVMIPAIWASEEEIFSLGDVLRDLGTGVIQCGSGRDVERESRMMSRLSQATGRQVFYNTLVQTNRRPTEYKELMAIVDETAAAGIRAYPLASPNSSSQRYTMKNCQSFSEIPTFKPILMASDEEKMRAYSDPEVRKNLHADIVEWSTNIPDPNLARNWYDCLSVAETALEKNQGLKDKTIKEVADAQGKGIVEAFLDLVVEENLETVFIQRDSNTDKEAVTKILNYPYAILGLSDGGAHVQFAGSYGYCTRLLGYWVREQQIMSLETAVRRLTFESATALGIFDRGILHSGMAADITIFDPDTVRPLPDDVVHDFPAGGWRIRQLAEGIKCTIVNGEPLIEDGKHTGALPGRVMRNTYYRANQ